MAIRAADQITIVDVTDAYNVHLTLDSYTFPGSTNAAKAGSCTTQVVAYLGDEEASATVTAADIVCPTGVSATVNQSGDYAGSPLITISVTTSVTTPGVVKIPVHVEDVVVNKWFSYGIALTGSTGTAAYNYLVGNDSAVIACDDTGAAKSAQTIEIPYSGYQGTSRKGATVTYSTLPTGMTASKTDATTSADGKLTLTVASGATLGGASNGTITLTIKVYSSGTTVGATYTHIFSWAKASDGTDGTNGTNATSPCKLTGGETSIAIPCTNAGVSKAAQTVTIPFGGYQGVTRVATTVAVSGLPSGITAGTNTAATASADGSIQLNVAASSNLGGNTTGQITLTYTIKGSSNVTEVKKVNWSKVIDGKDGVDGEDAYTLTIVSSAGTIFKNSDIVTTLTAHVYCGGDELSSTDIAALGTIKWYKDGGSTAVGTGATLSISAGDVTDKAIYEAKLESSES